MKSSEIVKLLSDKFDKFNQINKLETDDEIDNLLIDSRTNYKPGSSLFFALKTPGGNDGHKYINEAIKMGVRNLVVERLPDDELLQANYIVVDDSMAALREIGKSRRKNAKEVVAITGSRGKTMVKEIIFRMMEPYKKISRSPRSYNSRIGVPLSLWQISEGSDIALIEAGISKKGEMKSLEEMISPDTVIITNVGDAHSEGFNSMEEKAREKALLAHGKNVKTVIFPFSDLLLRDALKDLEGKKELISWGIKNDRETDKPDLELVKTSDGIDYYRKGEKSHINVEISKEYEIDNIGATLAFMIKSGLTADQIKKSFEQFTHIKTRLNVAEGINGCSIILDSYTSDLSSLLPAIDFMKRRKIPGQTLTLILSDLYHEGLSTSATYNEMAQIVRQADINKFIGIGENLKKYSELFPKDSKFYDSTEEYLLKFSPSDFNDEIILLKGNGEFGFDRISGELEAKKHETVLEVNLDALLRNYNYFRQHLPSSTGIIAMVKAAGYGAGSYEIAKTLQDAGASYLAVAALDEGIELRKNGITMPVMVMNPRAANYLALFKNRLEPVIYSMSMLKDLLKVAENFEIKGYPVHIKLDTGMHRMGFEKDELDSLIKILSHTDKIKVETIFSHLATADCLDMDYFTLRQLSRFEEMINEINKGIGYQAKRHILNSAGILRFPQCHYDFARLGIGLYGANTLPKEIETPLSPVSTLRSVIICIREIDGDETVGYSRKGQIKGKTKVATIPIGYADGMNRKFGNGAIKVMVNGKKVPTIGNICMDATMLDVTGVDCKEGDSVEIFGENINVSELSDILDTIPYEVLTSVSPRVKRIYYRE